MKRGKRIGVYICHCGRNIAGYVDVEELTKKVQELKWVSIVRQEKYMCSEQGQKTIKRDLREGLVDRVIVAACTPTMHEKTFRRCVSEAGLNPFLYQQVNIRENCSWVTEDKEQATEKAFKLIKGAVWRVRFLEPLFQLEYPVVPSCLIIGGGVAGITAALDISEAGFRVILVEREDQLGGWGRRISLGFPKLISVREYVEDRIKELASRPNVKIYLKSEVEEISGFQGDFQVKIRLNSGGIVKEKVGSIIVATGFSPFKAELKPEFGYRKYPQVLTTVDFEQLYEEGFLEGEGPKTVAFIQCVGSRDQTLGRTYCSRVCCTVVAKQALLLKEKFPKAKVYVFYMDVRTFGKGYEELYEEAQRKGVLYVRANPGEIYPKNDKLCIKYEDTLLQKTQELEVDMVVLAVGMDPPNGADELGRKLSLSRSNDGFYLEAHPKLGPLDTFSEGIFLAGCCQGPKDLVDTIAQAHGAASRATRIFHAQKVIKEPLVAKIDQEVCAKCRLCEQTCNFNAILYDERSKRMKVIETACKGCGACAANCPSGAMSLSHFRYPQVLPWIEALLD